MLPEPSCPPACDLATWSLVNGKRTPVFPTEITGSLFALLHDISSSWFLEGDLQIGLELGLSCPMISGYVCTAPTCEPFPYSISTPHTAKIPSPSCWSRSSVLTPNQIQSGKCPLGVGASDEDANSSLLPVAKSFGFLLS